MGNDSLGRDGYHQPLAPLGAPTPENVDAIFGAHPHPKTVSPFPPDFTRLIRAFHDYLLTPAGIFAKGIIKHSSSGKSREEKVARFPLLSVSGVFSCNQPADFASLIRLVQTLFLRDIPLKKLYFLSYPHLFVTLWINILWR
jgi:hypothetical protein